MADYTDRFSPAARKAWDDTFADDGRNDPNAVPTPGRLAQRARMDFEQNDPMGYASELLAQRRQALNEELTFNKGARDLWKMKEDIDFREKKAQADWQRNALIDANRAKSLELQIARDNAAAKAAASREEMAAKKAIRDAEIEDHANRYMSELADLQLDAPEDIADDIRDKVARKYPGAAVHEMTKDDVKTARERHKARQTEAARAEAATVANERRVDAAEARPVAGTTTGKSATPKIVDAELDQLRSRLDLGLSNQKKAKLAEQSQYEPGLVETRKKIAEREGALQWLQANPDDPRATAIRSKLGLK